MRRLFLLSFSAILFFSINSCQKQSTDNTALCHDGIKDGKETEIDCNGDCEPCAGVPSLSCTLGGTSYISTNVRGQTLNPSIRIYGNDQNGRPMNFMFLPGPLNHPEPVVSVTLSFDDDPYIYSEDDTGTVVITSQDTLRKVISGTFSFSARQVTKITKVMAKNGVFTNVRYGY